MLDYLAFTFVIFTSLIGTFFIAKTIYGLFFCDQITAPVIIQINQKNHMDAEYIIRCAQYSTNGTILVEYDKNDEEVACIVEKLAMENSRIALKPMEV